MPEIGLFPLELVLLPSERVPLHIFEDRYKELIGECLSDETEFGLILEDGDGLRQVGTRTGVLELVHTFDDGRLNVLVEGRERFRVVDLTGGRSFQTAEVDGVAGVVPVLAGERVVAGPGVQRTRGVRLVHQQDAGDRWPALVAGVGDRDRGTQRPGAGQRHEQSCHAFDPSDPGRTGGTGASRRRDGDGA